MSATNCKVAGSNCGKYQPRAGSQSKPQPEHPDDLCWAKRRKHCFHHKGRCCNWRRQRLTTWTTIGVTYGTKESTLWHPERKEGIIRILTEIFRYKSSVDIWKSKRYSQKESFIWRIRDRDGHANWSVERTEICQTSKYWRIGWLPGSHI